MSPELLRQDKIPTLTELRFLLQLVQDREVIPGKADLAAICQGHSVNLGRSFENGIAILDAAALLEDLGPDGVRIKRGGKNNLLIREDIPFCSLITKRLLEEMHNNGVLSVMFNQHTVKFDFGKDAISINLNLIPIEYPMMKVYLLNMGIAYWDIDLRSRILISNSYKSFFIEEVLKRVFQGSETLDIVTGEFGPPKPSNGPGLELPVNGVKVFISYSHKDDEYREELKAHFSGLIQNKVIKLWFDGLINPGEPWDATIKRNLDEADYILFIISSDFMNSNYIYDVEIKRAIERYKMQQVRIIPIIARPCDHDSLPISEFQVLPKGKKPISTWQNRDEAYVDIVMGFKKTPASKSRWLIKP